MDETWEDSYIVVYYADGEISYKTVSNNQEATEFLEELTEQIYDFDPHIHSMVIKTEKDRHAILTVETHKVTRVSVGGR